MSKKSKNPPISPDRRSFFDSLRVRTTLLILLIVLPLVIGTVLFFSYRADRIFRQNAENELAAAAHSLNANVTTWLQLNIQTLNQLVSLPDIISLDPARQKPILELTGAAHPHLFLVTTTDLTGFNIARNDDQENRDYSDRLWYQGAVSGKPVQFQSLVSRTTGNPALSMAAPIRNTAGDIMGVGAIVSELGDITKEVNAQKIGESGFAYITDETNTVIAHPDPAFAAELRDISETAPIQALRAGAQGIINYTDENGQRWLAYVEKTDYNWGVIVQQLESEVLGQSRAFWQFTIIVTVTIAVLIGIATWLMTRRITNPIAVLTDAASAISAGNLEQRVQVERMDEVGILGQAFNQMAEQIGGLLQTVRTRSAELEERTKELEASQRVTFAASEHATPDELLDLVVNLIRDQFNLYHAQVYMVNEQEQAAVLRQSTGYAGRQLLQRKHRIALDATALVTKAIHTGEAVLVDDVKADPNFLPNPLLPDTRSELVVPLKREGKVIGVLDAQDRNPGRFNPSTTALFQTMADQVTILFENSELLQRVTDQTEVMGLFTNQLRTAADIARRLGTILDPEQLLQEVVELIQSRFGLYHAHIYLLDEKAEILKLATGSGEVGRVLRERGHSIPLNAEKSLVARAARSRGAVLIADTTLESDFMPNPLLPQTRSELAIPLVVGDKVLGVLDMQDDQAGRFTEAERDTFSTLAGLVATSLQNATLFEERKQTEIALANSERRFRGLFEDTADGVLLLQAGKFIDCNRAALKMLHMDSKEQVVNTSPDEVSPEFQPDGRRSDEKAQEMIATALKQGSHRFEWIHQRADGVDFPVEVILTALGEPDNPLFHSLWRDISDRKRAEAEIQKRASELQTVAEVGTAASTILDPDRLLAQVVELTKTNFDLYHAHIYLVNETGEFLELAAGAGEAGKQMLAQGWKIAADSETSLVARAFRTREGVIVNDVRAAPDFLPNPLLPDTRSELAVPLIVGERTLGVLDVQSDQVDRFTSENVAIQTTLAGQIASALQNARLFEAQQQAQETIRESEARYSAVVTQAQDGIVIIQDNVLQFVNQALATMLGYTVEEMLNTPFVNYLPPEERVRVANRIKARLAGEDVPSVYESQLLHKDGTVIDAEFSGGVIEYRGRPADVGLIRDITERKKAEEERARLITILESTNTFLEKQGAALAELTRSETVYSGDLGVALQEITEAAAHTLGVKRSSIWLYDTSRTSIECSDLYEQDAGHASGVVLGAKDFPGYFEALAQERIIAANDAHSHPQTREFSEVYLTPLGINSMLDAPIRLAGKMIGVVCNEHTGPVREWTLQEQAFAASTADFVASAMEARQRKQAEAAILQERNFSTSVINSLPGIFYVVDEQARITRWNKQYEVVTEYSPEEMSIIGALGPIAEEERAFVGEQLQQVLVTGEAAAEVHIATKSGKRIPYYLSGIRAEIEGKTYVIGTGIDISERVRAETAVRESQQRLSLLVAQSPLAVIEWNTDFEVVAWNEAAEQIFGYSREEAIGHHAAGLIVPEAARDIVNEVWQNLLKQIGGSRSTNDNFTKDGRTITCEWYNSPLVDANGNTLGVASLVADITERRQAEAALRESEQRLSEALNVAQMGYWAFDAVTGTFTFNDQYYKAILNTTAEEVNGYQMSAEEFTRRFVAPEDAHDVAGSVQRLMESTDPDFQIQLESRNVTIDGEVVWATVWMAPEKDAEGRNIGSRGVSQIITERKLAEAEIEKRASELQTVAEVSTAASTILDPDRLLSQVVELTKANFGLYHAHIYLIDEAGESLVLAAGAGEAGAQMKAQGWKIAADSETSLVARAFRTRQGVIVNDVRSAPDFLPNPLLPDTRAELAVPLIVGERVLGVLDVQSDQVDRFTREDVLIQTTLAGQIATAIENARLFQESRQVDRLKSEFLANMSHELRTPLNSIIGYTQLLLMDLEGEIPEESYEDMQSIDTNSKHLLSLINDILDLAKIEAGRLELHMEEMDVASLLDTIKSNNAGLFIDSALTFAVEVEEALPAIYADSIRITQVLNNLISNAFKFTEAGGITVRAYREESDICIAIQDTGIGISEEDLEAVFERFRQVDGSFARRAEGTGLGLSITRLLVELHNGKLTVRSKLGEGSTFTVHLPAVE